MHTLDLALGIEQRSHIVCDRLDLMIQRAESLVPTIRIYSHDKNFAPSF